MLKIGEKKVPRKEYKKENDFIRDEVEGIMGQEGVY